MVIIKIGKVKFADIKGIIFDKDGTLQDSHQFLWQLALKRARMVDAQIPGIGEPLLMAFGVQDQSLDPTGLMAVGSHKENEIAAAAYIAETGRSWYEAKNIARIAFEEADKYMFTQSQGGGDRSEISPLFAGSLEVIKELFEGGLKLGILSADTTENVEKFVQVHQLSPYIDLMMGVDSNLTKPDPRLFLQACDKLGLDPQNTLMVGDSAGDIEMAQKANAGGTIGICWGKPEASHLERADITISSLEQLKISD
jgi:phosphoglycolate phosphatase